MFGKNKNTKTYDSKNEKPVIHCSICTGEQSAGFKDIHSGKFHEVMLIRNEQDLNKFNKMYGLKDVEKDY